MKTSQDIRRAFLQFFKERGHALIPSSSVVPMNDPTLLFTNAGMNQFKEIFLGKDVRDFSTAVTTQKCIRVGGKHNDLENVGHTARHLTFFEMLGNFSFGDYFKEKAIDYGWEVTTQIFGFVPERLFVTVYHEDEEAFELWKKYFPEERIIRMGKKDNFWAMGETGPCGPCSELYFDKGEKYGKARHPGEDLDGVRYLEFWNLVFMQYNLDSEGRMHPLPKKSVDTGAGLERIISLIMGVDSVYETDIFRQLIEKVEIISKKPYESHSKLSPAFHVIADHLRTLCFAIADGVIPSNLDRGYVLRKVLRRAVRYGRQLGIDHPFLAEIVPTLIDQMGADFPELITSQRKICDILTDEEDGFLKTLRRGGNILQQIISSSQKAEHLSGEDAFKLKDTYGLPLEEIILLAKDSNLSVDIKRFEELEHEAKLRSRAARKTVSQVAEESIYEAFRQTHGACHFLGYKELTAEATVLGILKNNTMVSSLYEGEEGSVILDRTPFYAEKGGQVGDQGIIQTTDAQFEVIDCQSPFADVITHVGVMREGEIHIGDQVSASVDFSRRSTIAAHHTATHLLHWALQQVLGLHIKQAGSVVEASRLRFDFTHNQALTQEEIAQIEDLVNQKIRENREVQTYELSYAEAQKHQEIKQFFDKYGSIVRVVDIDFSKELCGGTHVHRTGEIGYFRILKEGSISAGVRRIEAVVGGYAETMARENDSLLARLTQKLAVQPAQMMEKVDSYLTENEMLRENLFRLQRRLLSQESEQLLQKIEYSHSLPFLLKELATTPEQLETVADLIIEKQKSLVLFLVGKTNDKCTLIARVTPDLVKKGIQANELIKVIAPLVDGKGGGKAEAARGGGTAVEKIGHALQQARLWIEQKTI